MSSLKGKSILFLGDSIAAGFRDDEFGGERLDASKVKGGRGWSKRLSDAYGVKATNNAVSGASITKHRTRNHILSQIEASVGKDYDAIILEGGYNDFRLNKTPEIITAEDNIAPLGKMSKLFEINDFDTTTFAGSLEYLFYTARLLHPNAVIGYIVTYATPLSNRGGITASFEKAKKYWDTAKSICEKWQIPYLDLFEGFSLSGKSFSEEILKTNTSLPFQNDNDFTHLSGLGYDIITPHIAEWLMDILL